MHAGRRRSGGGEGAVDHAGGIGAGLRTSRRILGHHRIDQRLVAREWRRQRRAGRADVLHADVPAVGALERQFAGEQLVEHDAQAVEVGAAIEFLALQLFRAHVIGRAQGHAFLGHGDAGIGGAGDAEIGQRA